MNKWTLKSLAATAVGLLTLAGQADAAVSYSYVTDAHQGSVPGANYSVNPGAAQSIKLYLLETLDGGSTSIITADAGVAGAAMRIQRAAGAPAGASSLGLFTYNSAATEFGGPNDDPNQVGGGSGTQTATEVAFRETGPLAGASPVPGNGGAANAKAGGVYLGTLNVNPGDVGTVTTFNLLRYDPTSQNGSGDTITTGHPPFFTDSKDLDAAAGTGYTGTAAHLTTFSVTVVPEPTFAGVAMVLGAAGSLIRRRRQQA